MRLWHQHSWKSFLTPDSREVYACECGRIKLRCKKYPYGRNRGVVWCPYAECECDKCKEETRPLTLDDLKPDN